LLLGEHHLIILEHLSRMATLSKDTTEMSSESLEMKVSPAADAQETSSPSPQKPAASYATAAAAAASSTLPETLEEQEAAVFASTGEGLADAMAEFVERGIQSGVASLPLLQESQKSKALVDMIQKPYMKHIDVMEAYAQRNIFTLRHSAPRRRQLIVRRFLEEPTDGPATLLVDASAVAAPDEESPSSSSSAPAPAAVYPNKEEIPSKKELATLQEELSQLAMQLQTAKDRRNALIEQGASLAATQSMTVGAVQSLEAANLQGGRADAVQGPVTAAVMGGQGLQELTREGKRLQTELGKRKQNTSNEQGDEDLAQDGLPIVQKKRVLTMEEAYRHERQAVETTVENLSSLSNLLKQSKRIVEETN
jgi:hypothetical protein